MHRLLDATRVPGVRNAHELRSANRRVYPLRLERNRRDIFVAHHDQRGRRDVSKFRHDRLALDHAIHGAPDITTIARQSLTPGVALDGTCGITEERRAEHDRHDLVRHDAQSEPLRHAIERAVLGHVLGGLGLSARFQQHTRPYEIRATRGEAQGDEAAHGQSNDVHRCHTELFDERYGVGITVFDADGAYLRHVALALATMIPGNAAVSRAQRRHLRVEHARAPEQPVREHYGRSASPGVLDPESNTVDGEMLPVAAHITRPAARSRRSQ